MPKYEKIQELDATPDLVYYHPNPLVRAIFRKRLDVALKLSDKKGIALDLGCGDGYLLPYIENRFNAIGVDISKGRLERAKSRSKAFLCLTDILKLPFYDETFDVIFCIDILEHIENLDSALAEISRILKREGELIISIPTENMLYKLGQKIAGTFSIGHVHSFSEVLNFLKPKFRIINQRGIPFIFPIFNLNLFIVIKAVKKTL